MNVLARRDRLGSRMIYFEPGSGEYAEDLAVLLARVPEARRGGLDPRGIDVAWGLAPSTDDASRTCLRGVRCVPPGVALVRNGDGRVALDAASARSSPPLSSSVAPSLESVLLGAASRAFASARRPIVALGGGIDAPLAVLAMRGAGIAIESAVHVSLPGTSYDESAAARETATAIGLRLHEVRLTTSDLAAALPRAVRLAGTALYNMHPVSRVVTARAARDLGHDVLVTGDGADQAARGAIEPADYVPIVAAITRGCGIALASPFADDDLVDLLVRLRDPSKNALRALARVWGLPDSVAGRPKVPCMAPALPRAAFPVDGALVELSRALGRTLAWSADDRVNVGVTSLAAFVRAFEIDL